MAQTRLRQTISTLAIKDALERVSPAGCGPNMARPSRGPPTHRFTVAKANSGPLNRHATEGKADHSDRPSATQGRLFRLTAARQFSTRRLVRHLRGVGRD